MLAAFLLLNGLLLLPALALPGPAPWLALEALIIWWLLHQLPNQRSRLVLLFSGTYALMVWLIAADALVRQSLGRGLNLYLEVGLLDSAWHLLRTNLGIPGAVLRSEEHTSELQSRPHLVCRLLLEKKKNMYR